MGSFRTSSVFRFTKDFEMLKRIIRDGIIPNYCEEDLSFDGVDFCVGIPMASFCDIPITLLDEHNNRYGNYGIALSKEWAKRKGLTPVMYIANDDVLQSVYHHYQRNQEMLDWYHQDDVKAQLAKDTLIKGFPLENYVKMLSAEQEHAVNTHIIGYLKKYEGIYNKKPINNYEENEWRYLVPDEKGTNWFWTKEDYLKWRFPVGDTTVKKPLPTDELKKHTLEFDATDIKYILVKDDDFKARVIDFIKGLKSIGGRKLTSSKAYEDLITRIITLDQVKMDF